MTARRAGVYVIAVSMACAGKKPAPGARVAADEVFATVLDVHFGAPIAALQATRPSLAASGWREGAQATYLDPTVEQGAEITADGDAIRAVAIDFADERADAEEHELYGRLGPSVECSAVNADVQGGFKPILWRTTDGGSVTMLRKKRVLAVRVEKPASAAFEKAWRSCR